MTGLQAIWDAMRPRLECGEKNTQTQQGSQRPTRENRRRGGETGWLAGYDGGVERKRTRRERWTSVWGRIIGGGGGLSGSELDKRRRVQSLKSQQPARRKARSIRLAVLVSIQAVLLDSICLMAKASYPIWSPSCQFPSTRFCLRNASCCPFFPRQRPSERVCHRSTFRRTRVPRSGLTDPDVAHKRSTRLGSAWFSSVQFGSARFSSRCIYIHSQARPMSSPSSSDRVNS